MSPKSTSKKRRFANAQRDARLIKRIHQVNEGRPGYIGACTGMTINGKRIGAGAMFIQKDAGK